MSPTAALNVVKGQQRWEGSGGGCGDVRPSAVRASICLSLSQSASQSEAPPPAPLSDGGLLPVARPPAQQALTNLRNLAWPLLSDNLSRYGSGVCIYLLSHAPTPGPPRPQLSADKIANFSLHTRPINAALQPASVLKLIGFVFFLCLS